MFFLILWNTDYKRYFTLSYANGPGAIAHLRNGERIDPAELELDKDFVYPGVVPLSDETHGGDDVGVFASGKIVQKIMIELGMFR